MPGKIIKLESKKRISILAAMVLGASLLGLAPSSAADVSIKACVNSKTGAVRILLKGVCNTKTEKKITLSTASVAAPALPSIWLSPTDLKAGYAGASVESVLIGGYFAEVLKAPEGWGFSTVALPKGWGSASSLTYKIHWIVVDDVPAGTTVDNSFVVAGKGWNAGDEITTAGCSSSCKIAANPTGKGKLQVATFTIPNPETFALKENQLLQVWFGRNYESKMTVPVYVYGVQITANK